jgi:hypothetical protein
MTPPTGYTEDALADMSPEELDFRISSGLREWNERSPGTFCLFTRYQGRLVLNTPRRP